MSGLGVLVALAAAGVGQGAEPARRAVVVGINRYDRAPALDFAAADAAGLAALLRPAGYQVELLTDAAVDPAHKPTQENIEAALRRALRSSNKGDTLLVSLSGHGRQFQGRPCFFPSDGEPQKPASMVSMDGLYAAFENCQATNKVLFVDACRDEDGGGVTQVAARLPCGTAVLFGCSAGEVSLEFEPLGHGLFFHLLLRGLEGEARSPTTGAVSFSSLVEHVTHRIGPAGDRLRKGYTQTPHTQYSYCGPSPVLIPGEGGWAAATPMPAAIAPPPRTAARPPAELPQRMPAERPPAEPAPPPAPNAAARREEAQRLHRQGQDAKFGRRGEAYSRATAAELFRRAADLGEPLAMVALFQMATEQGQPGTAAAWLGRAVDADGSGGLLARGLASFTGAAGQPRDPARAVGLLEQAAADGCLEARAELGSRYLMGNGVPRDDRRAAQFLRPAAAAEHPCSQVNLGSMYLDGRGGLPKDQTVGIQLVRAAAANGCETAMRDYAEWVLSGQAAGTPQQGVEMLARAADRGCKEAANTYGAYLTKGLYGLRQDHRLAMYYFQLAAEKGDPAAARNIGVMHRDGRGVPADVSKAKFWLGKAAAAGFPDAAAERAALGYP